MPANQFTVAPHNLPRVVHLIDGGMRCPSHMKLGRARAANGRLATSCESLRLYPKNYIQALYCSGVGDGEKGCFGTV